MRSITNNWLPKKGTTTEIRNLCAKEFRGGRRVGYSLRQGQSGRGYFLGIAMGISALLDAVINLDVSV